MVTDNQIRRLLQMQHKYKHKYQAADAAGIDVKTARKYLSSRRLPSQCKTAHTWRTRKDPFVQDWDYIEKILTECSSSLQVKSIFEHLQAEFPGRYSNNQLRTLQRHVKAWKALKGPAKEAFFPQTYYPGQWSCSDFTNMNKLGITINCEPFNHIVYHFVLCYSNWQSCRICFSESFESLSMGLQDALWKLGGVPAFHRSDNLSSAVKRIGSPGVFTEHYTALCSHYGIKSAKTNTYSPHENGDVEKSNDLLKKSVERNLLFRGSRDFDNLKQYERFLQDIVNRMNKDRQKYFSQEIEQLRPLPVLRYNDYRTKSYKVGKTSTIRVMHNTYSVNSRLIGERIDVRIYADKLEIWYGNKHIEDIGRLRGRYSHLVNYRHIIETLVRKPGAFENYRFKEDLYPSSIFRIAYDILCERLSLKEATKQYLNILKLAAQESEDYTNEALRYQINTNDSVSFEVTEHMVKKKQVPPGPTDVNVEFTDICSYDALLTNGGSV
jgi:hypothetical protein